MADIFISYSRKDRKIARKLADALEQRGFDVWWDFDLLSGEHYRRAIRAVIDHCKVAVVLWSGQSAESDFVLDEAAYAKAQSKLRPVRIDPVALPFGFGQLQTDDLKCWDGDPAHPALESLVRALEVQLGPKPAGADAMKAPTELDAFIAAQTAHEASALRAFVTRYPSGPLAAFAKTQLEPQKVHDASQTPAPRRRSSLATRWRIVAASAVAAGLVIAASPRLPAETSAPEIARSWPGFNARSLTQALGGQGDCYFLRTLARTDGV
jgi:hypothetical protein